MDHAATATNTDIAAGAKNLHLRIHSRILEIFRKTPKCLPHANLHTTTPAVWSTPSRVLMFFLAPYSGRLSMTIRISFKTIAIGVGVAALSFGGNSLLTQARFLQQPDYHPSNK